VKATTLDRRVYWLVLGIYIVLAFASITSGVTSWDEETDYLGLRDQISHAAYILLGRSPDFHDIYANLEYYGIISLLPAWFFWLLQNSVLAGRMPLDRALFYANADPQLTGFYQISHVFVALEFILLSFLLVRIAGFLKAKYPYIPGAICLCIPSLTGHSFVNAKDIPFAFLYTLYTYSLLARASGHGTFRLTALSVLSAGALVNLKLVFIAPLIIFELILGLFVSPRRYILSLVNIFTVAFFALSLALALQPASWGGHLIMYLKEAFSAFSSHSWSGCMYWGGSCVGVGSGEWSTLVYILKWLSVKMPLFLVFLLLVSIFVLVINKRDSIVSVLATWFPVLLQLLLLPALAVLRNSNLYDADRHLLFIYPPICLVTGSALGYLIANARKYLIALVLSLLLFLSMLLDDIMMNPYQSAYLNEPSRFFHDHTTTSLDYWAVSAKEALRGAQLRDFLPLSPSVLDNQSLFPVVVSLRQIGGSFSSQASKSIVFQVRDPSAYVNLPSCSGPYEVSRSLWTGHRLVLSRLSVCDGK